MSTATSATSATAAMRWLRTSLTASALLLTCGATLAQDRADIDRTVILGNRELPKVIYIVPWKKPIPGELAGRPLVSVVDEALAPIDRDVFRRQMQYQSQQAQRLAVAQAQAQAQAQALAQAQAAQAAKDKAAAAAATPASSP